METEYDQTSQTVKQEAKDAIRCDSQGGMTSSRDQQRMGQDRRACPDKPQPEQKAEVKGHALERGFATSSGRKELRQECDLGEAQQKVTRFSECNLQQQSVTPAEEENLRQRKVFDQDRFQQNQRQVSAAREHSIEKRFVASPEQKRSEQGYDLGRPEQQDVCEGNDNSEQSVKLAEQGRMGQSKVGYLENWKAKGCKDESTQKGMVTPSVGQRKCHQSTEYLDRPKPEKQKVEIREHSSRRGMKMTPADQCRYSGGWADDDQDKRHLDEGLANVGNQIHRQGMMMTSCDQKGLRQTPPGMLAPDFYRFGAMQPVVGDLIVGGSNNPTFLAPLYSPTLNFVQNVTMAAQPKGTAGEPERSNQSSPHIESGPSRSPGNVKDANPGSGTTCESRQTQIDLMQETADFCQHELETLYTTTGCYVQMLPWVDDDTRHIMEIYTTLWLEKYGNKAGDKASYRDIFLITTKGGKLIKRAILCGSAGLGKSTLIAKIAFDWATGCWTSTPSSVLQGFKLVFALKLHAVEQATDLIDAIFDQLLDEDTHVDRKALASFIDTYPEKVLVLLDGFDELMTTNLEKSRFGSVLKLLSRKRGRELFVIITTRPSHLGKLASRSLLQKPFTHVSVLGFDVSDIKTYVDKFFSEDVCKAQGLFERISSSGVLSDLAKSPMLLLLMCLLWRADACLPETTSRLYRASLAYIFNRKSDVSEEDMQQVLIPLGEIALGGLVSPTQRLAFQEREFEKSVLDKAFKAGILTSQRVLRGLHCHNSVQFIHKTFQEFTAATYFQSLSEDEAGKLQRVLDQIEAPHELEYLLRFSCGDDKTCTHAVLQMLRDRIDALKERNEQSSGLQTLGFACYFESQSNMPPPEDFVGSILQGRVCVENYNIEQLNWFVYFLGHVMDERKIHFTNIRELSISSSQLCQFSEDLASQLCKMASLSVLELPNCSLTCRDMIHIAPSFRQTVHLTKLDLSSNSLSCFDEEGNVSGALWFPELQYLTVLQSLSLDECLLKIQDVKCLADSIGSMESLVHCSVRSSLWPDVGHRSEVFLVEPHKAGIAMSLCDFSLSGLDLAEVLRPLIKRSDLAELHIRDNTGLGGSGATWCQELAHLRYLHRMTVYDNDLNMQDVRCLAGSVGCMKNLVAFSVDLDEGEIRVEGASSGIELVFRRCSVAGSDVADILQSMANRTDFVSLLLCEIDGLSGSVDTWSPQLKRQTQLKQLAFFQCALRSTDVERLGASLAEMDALEHLEVQQFEPFLSGTAPSWAHHIRSMKHLQKLSLDCLLLSDDVPPIVTSVGRVASLGELDLSGNKALGCGRGASWAKSLRGMHLVHTLRLCQCSLQADDAQHIASALSGMSNLAELDLSRNCALGCGASWAPFLSKMSHLKALRLSDCSLQAEDVKQVVVALTEMHNLVELDISFNSGLGNGRSSLWAPNMSEMKYIHKLVLKGCSLTTEDRKQISESRNNMPALVELNVEVC